MSAIPSHGSQEGRATVLGRRKFKSHTVQGLGATSEQKANLHFTISRFFFWENATEHV
jgi:hypothetical protein